MKRSPKNIISYLAMILVIILITACFISSMVVIQDYAEEDCYDNIENTATQLSNMFIHTMEQAQTQLTMFADVLVANSTNTDEQLILYMQNFCKTQVFSGVCIHRKDGSVLSYNYHSHSGGQALSFTTEANKAPYISNVISSGDSRDQKYIYQAVPIVRGGEKVAVLYGYISLSKLPTFVSTTEYDGKGKFYIVDGSDGNFVMDEFHRYDKDLNEIKLGNLFDASMANRTVKSGYSVAKMRDDITQGKSGYFVFKSAESGEWCYAYYMPVGVNSWMLQFTVDESVAFEAYYRIRSMIVALMVSAVFLMAIVVLLIMLQNLMRRRADTKRLMRADYMNSVQSALISAHNNPYFVDRALEIIGNELKAETVLLLTFEQRVVTQAQYWPSQDKKQAMALIGVNIRDVFPKFFDALAAKRTVIFDSEDGIFNISETAAKTLEALAVSDMMLVPINDNSGLLKGAIAAVNVPEKNRDSELLECVSRDFFMAITNLENHKIIKKMGEIDYLTGLKNRNSFETELANYEVMSAENLWFIYVDANGLHELNNKKGHKAGDLMLCTVADTMKKIFGSEQTYRLGGDEFVAFRHNSSHEEMMNCKYRLVDELDKRGYSVSAGFEGITKNENRVFDVEKLVSDAERMMYKNKKEYYESNKIVSERYRSETV